MCFKDVVLAIRIVMNYQAKAISVNEESMLHQNNLCMIEAIKVIIARKKYPREENYQT